MEMLSIEKELQENSYPGRGIIIGRSADGAKAVGTAYPYHADRPGADRSRGSTDSVCRIIHKTVCFVPSRR